MLLTVSPPSAPLLAPGLYQLPFDLQKCYKFLLGVACGVQKMLHQIKNSNLGKE